jgi:hypothetical protein
MDLQALLKKTEQRSTKVKATRAPPSIATEERPYTNDFAVAPSPTPAILEPNKPGTNREQTGNKSGTELRTNWEQTGNRTENSVIISSVLPGETGNKPGTQLGTELRTNREQTGNKSGTEPRFLSLSGLQRGTVLFMYSLCRAGGTRTTENVRLDAIASSLETTPGAIKETIKRLATKGFIQRINYRAGRGGFSSYALPEEIYRHLFELETGNKLGTNWEHFRNKLGTQLGTQLGTSSSSSSSSIDSENFKTTTTGEPELFESTATQLSPDWAAVDFSALAEIGFTQSHLIQLAKHGKLSTAEVQDSIHFFAFDLKRNGKGREIKGAPVNFFMGILRKGLPYAPPENYESPEQTARRIYLDGKRRLEEQRLSEERELRDLEFAEWRRGITREQIADIVPDVVRDIIPARDSSLKAHFDEQVWPARCAAIPGSVEAEQVDIRRQIKESLGEVRG